MDPNTLFNGLKEWPCWDAFNHICIDIFLLNIDWEIDRQKSRGENLVVVVLALVVYESSVKQARWRELMKLKLVT